jgi:transposase
VAAWAATSGASTPRSSGPVTPPPGRKKNPGRARVLAGPKAAQLQEPPDHALGYSRGGFGTKVHLVCEDHGILLGIYVTPGQRHESKFFETVIERVMVPHRRGQPYWPERMAGDKGYSYRHIRRWMKRHGTRGVIPTRKDQPRDLGFEKAQYRRRNIVERAVGWYKECRHLATRYDKLAVNYVAFWLVAMMERDLRFLGLSDTA